MSSRSAYIPLHGDVFSNKKTIAAAGELTNGNVEKMVGHLARLWTWAVERNDDGNLEHLTDRMIADAAGWRGGASRFVAAVTSAGFLDPDRRLHDWDDYAGVLVDRRERDRERKRLERGDPTAGARGRAVIEANRAERLSSGPSNGHSADSPPRNVPDRTVPERRVGADTDGQVSASAPSLSGVRTRGGTRLTEEQLREHVENFVANGMDWPLDRKQTRLVFEALASDPSLLVSNLDSALTTYFYRLDTSPLEAKTPRGVENALRPWLASYARREVLSNLMHDKRGSNEILYDKLGTDQYGDMSDGEIEQAIAILK